LKKDIEKCQGKCNAASFLTDNTRSEKVACFNEKVKLLVKNQLLSSAVFIHTIDEGAIVPMRPFVGEKNLSPPH